MNHLDPSELALSALGETVPAAEEHLEVCAECRAERAGLYAVSEAVRSGPRPDELLAPPGGVWDRIEAEIAVPPRRRLRLRPGLFVLAACLVVVVLGAIGVSLVTGGEEAGEERAALSALPGKAGSGEVRLRRTSDGARLSLTTAGLPVPAGFYEVWLLDASASRLISLGALPASGVADFVLPPGLDVGAYPLVDVSLEPFDGDPGHSKDSFVRGRLQL